MAREPSTNQLGVTEAKAKALRDAMSKVGLDERDIDEAFVRAPGKGGQKKNKTSMAVQLTHRPTGLQTIAHRDRSRARNRFFARRQLVELLGQHQGVPTAADRKAAKIRKQKQRRRRRGVSDAPDVPSAGSETS